MIIALFYTTSDFILHSILIISILAIGTTMQQLNVLSMNVSQNVETKDDTIAFSSSSSKDDFSQHIDLHLAKNKEFSDNQSKALDRNVKAKTDNSVTEQKNLKSDVKNEDNLDNSKAITDEVDSATNAQEVAADGKKDVTVLNKEIIDEVDPDVDESELLMSFLTKVDKTLVNKDTQVNDVAGTTSLNESNITKAKQEADLLLKSSDLVADLSSIAKAVTSNTETSSEDFTEQDKAVNSLILETKNTKENLAKGQLIDAEGSAENKLADKKLADAKIINANNNGIVNKDSTTNQSVNLAQQNKESLELNQQSKNAQQLANTDLKNEEVNSSDTEIENKNTQQGLMSGSKDNNLKNSAQSTKFSSNNESTINSQNSADIDSNVDEKIAKLMKQESNSNKVGVNSASTVAVTQNLVSQTTNKSASPAGAEPTFTKADATEISESESDIQLTSELEKDFVEQNKEVSLESNKGATVKPTTNVESSLTTNHSIGETNRTSEVAYDKIEQQSAELFNLKGSAEVSQSQKTNTQLHQETISIFRRDFSDAVKDKVMLMISQKLQQFDITLDPPELGNMQVRVNLQGEQATVNFVVQNQQAKESLEQNMHKLRDLLAEQGVEVGDANVEQQSQQSDAEENTSDNKSGFMGNTADASDVIEHDLSAQIHNTSLKGIDYYA
jgi:flagellar hook-length control protein FliK